jgi:hypothetical protein
MCLFTSQRPMMDKLLNTEFEYHPSNRSGSGASKAPIYLSIGYIRVQARRRHSKQPFFCCIQEVGNM